MAEQATAAAQQPLALADRNAGREGLAATRRWREAPEGIRTGDDREPYGDRQCPTTPPSGLRPDTSPYTGEALARCVDRGRGGELPLHRGGFGAVRCRGRGGELPLHRGAFKPPLGDQGARKGALPVAEQATAAVGQPLALADRNAGREGLAATRRWREAPEGIRTGDDRPFPAICQRSVAVSLQPLSLASRASSPYTGEP